jgi:hypothetical protein
MMLSADETRTAGKSGQRKEKNRGKKKAEQRAKTAAQPAATAEQLPDAHLQEASPEISREISVPAAAAEFPSHEVVAVEAPARLPARAAESTPVSLQTIANAYGSYTKTAFDQAFAFFGKLATARSPAEALALQMAFAMEACETLAAGAQRIGELHGELARQRALNLESLVARITQTTFELRATRH